MNAVRPLAADLEEAIVEIAQRLFGEDTELAALLEKPEMRSITLGELLDAVRLPQAAPRPYLQPLPGRAPHVDMRARLSERELEVVRLIVEGLSNKEISNRLALSDKTVKNHISHILAKLKLTARTQVAVLALRGGVF